MCAHSIVRELHIRKTIRNVCCLEKNDKDSRDCGLNCCFFPIKRVPLTMKWNPLRPILYENKGARSSRGPFSKLPYQIHWLINQDTEYIPESNILRTFRIIAFLSNSSGLRDSIGGQMSEYYKSRFVINNRQKKRKTIKLPK